MRISRRASLVGSGVQEQSGFAVDVVASESDGRRRILIGAGFADHPKNTGSADLVNPR